MTPNRKVSAAGVAGALSILAVWAAHKFGGVEVEAEIASAFTTVMAFAVAYLVPEPKASK